MFLQCIQTRVLFKETDITRMNLHPFDEIGIHLIKFYEFGI